MDEKYVNNIKITAKDSLLLHFCRFKEEERFARVYIINFNQRHFLIFFLCSISGSHTLAATTRIRRRCSLRPPPPFTFSEEQTINITTLLNFAGKEREPERPLMTLKYDNFPQPHFLLRTTNPASFLGNDFCPASSFLGEVEESVKVPKDAANMRKVAAEKVLSALSVIEEAKIDPSGFLETLGGNESPGRT
ncbi:hypothetical protein Ahy_A06g030531 [Arachis hypogaea]|uniref:Uncharacterized protein n=1 Tax=Arachis hypogaea TaxID=3818 RepID=A0A445CWJ5_ARAHY|nr:hypothetical protein Ahy_A06g030531 [Arachis hypogaea]